MLKITPAVRLSLGLLLLTVSILLIAQVLGLTPDLRKSQLEARQNLAETLAFQTLLAYSRKDEVLVKQLLENAVERNDNILSAAVRSTGGELAVYTPRHGELWPAATDEHSTERYARIPLFMAGQQLGHLELAFEPLNRQDTSYFGLPRQLLLAVFILIVGFISYRLLIGRTLRYLDPSSVVPERVRNALNVLAEGVLILDKREQVVLANKVIAEYLQMSEKSLLGRKASSLGWQTHENSELPWLRTLNAGERVTGARLLLGSDKKHRLVFRVNSVPITDAKGRAQGIIASFSDVSELEEKTRKLEHLASHDPLTGCLNRRALRQALNQVFIDAQNHRGELCCIMLDIDHFKRINDTHGHSVGDEVIKTVAQTVKHIVREGDSVARFGGEEFCIILPGSNLEQASQIAERCRTEIQARDCDGVQVTSSFGISSVRSGIHTPNELIQRADEALYQSKENGRNRVTLWQAQQ